MSYTIHNQQRWARLSHNILLKNIKQFRSQLILLMGHSPVLLSTAIQVEVRISQRFFFNFIYLLIHLNAALISYSYLSILFSCLAIVVKCKKMLLSQWFKLKTWSEYSSRCLNARQIKIRSV